MLTRHVLVFPLTFATLFDPTPIKVGVKGIGYGISVTLGAVVFNMLLTAFKKFNREVLLVATVIMTAFIGALAAVTPATPQLAVALGDHWRFRRRWYSGAGLECGIDRVPGSFDWHYSRAVAPPSV